MTKREMELIEKEIITEEELKELTEANEYVGFAWFVIKDEDGEEYSVYVKY